MADEQNNMRSFRLPVNAGTNTDEFSEDVPLQETSNFVMLPDGSGLKPREGFEVRRNDGISYGTGRKLMYFISNPPDIDYGDMIVLNSTRDGRQFIEQTEVVRTTNTRSLENPMSMPDLPPYVPPVPDIHPIFMAKGLMGETSGADVVFFDTATDTVAGAVRLNFGGYMSRYAYLFRTENYIVGVDRREYDDGQVRLLAWLISDCVDAPPEGPTPAVNISVYVDVAEATPFKPVWAYAGDVVFIADDIGSAAHTATGPASPNHDYRLYKVDLATAAVTSVAITGLPADFWGFGNREYDCDGVCSDGYLWTVGYGNSNQIMVKIDPVDGSVVASRVMVAPPEFFMDVAFSPLADGEMMYQDIDDNLHVVSADLTNDTQTTPPAGMQFWMRWTTMRNSFLPDGRTVGYVNEDYEQAAVVNPLTGFSGAVRASTQTATPASIMPGGTKFAVVTEVAASDFDSVTIFDAVTGASTTIPYSYDDSWASYASCFTDAFAYGIQHLQGNRL